MTSAQKVSATPASAQPGGAATAADDSALGQYLPAFKRKRIEKWCLEVAQHLRSGSLCRSVLGHPVLEHPVMEHPVLGHPVQDSSKGLVVATPRIPFNAADRGSSQQETPRVGTASIAPGGTSGNAATAVSGGGSLTGKLTLAVTSTGLVGLNGNLAAAVQAKSEQAHHESSSSPVFSPQGVAEAGLASPVSVVKLSYYGEQRRRIERLVLGLPVFPSAGPSTGGGPAPADRMTSYTSGSSGVTIYVTGEEPLRGSSARRGSAARPTGPGTRGTPACVGYGPISRANSAEPRLQYEHRGAASAGQPSVSRTRCTASPAQSGRVLLQKNRPNVTSSSQHYSKLLTSAEVVVIEESVDLFRFGKPGNSESSRTGFPSLKFNLNSVHVKKPPPQKTNKEK